MSPDAFAVHVPATTANLGPGFDAVGVALALPLRARVRPARRFALHVGGSQAPTHDAYAQSITRALLAALGDFPKISIEADNEIPLGKGLGSSAAAIVLGLAVGQKLLCGRLDRRRLAKEAALLEGHPDNAYAAVYGGTIVSAAASHVKLPAPRDLRAVVVVPNVILTTTEARALLPETYSRADAAFTAGRASLLGAALATGSWHALADAMRDRLHHPYRSSRIPGLSEALALSARGLLGIALSGAGPSVLAIARVNAASRIGEAIRACFARRGIEASVMNLAFARAGATVRGLTQRERA